MISKLAHKIALNYKISARGAWGGEATIDFPIIRYVDPAGKISMDDEAGEEHEYICKITGNGYYQPETRNDPSEGDFEITGFSCNCPGIEKFEDLDKDEQWLAEEAVVEAIKDRSYSDYESEDF